MVEVRKVFRISSPPFSYLIKLYLLILRQDRKREIRRHKKQKEAPQPAEKQESQHNKVFLSPQLQIYNFLGLPPKTPVQERCGFGRPLCKPSDSIRLLLRPMTPRATLESHWKWEKDEEDFFKQLFLYLFIYSFICLFVFEAGSLTECRAHSFN